MMLGMISLSGMQTSYPAIAQIKKFGHALGIDPSPRESSLMLLGSLSIGSAYPDIILTDFLICAQDRWTAGRI